MVGPSGPFFYLYGKSTIKVMSRELIQDAIQCFGEVVVREALSVVHVSDPDCAYTTFMDMGMEDCAECVEMLFFC